MSARWLAEQAEGFAKTCHTGEARRRKSHKDTDNFLVTVGEPG
jgi:hypothetical protein